MSDIEDFASRRLRTPFECDELEEQLYLHCIEFACIIQEKHTGVDSRKLAVSVLRTLAWLIRVKENTDGRV